MRVLHRPLKKPEQNSDLQPLIGIYLFENKILYLYMYDVSIPREGFGLEAIY
jgi:hypothetical protein